MYRKALSGMILGLMLNGGAAFASEIDQIREKANAMCKEAQAHAERGNKEQAERLENEAKKLLESAERMALKAEGRPEKSDRPGPDKEVQQLKERLQNLLNQEKKLRTAKGPEKELAALREKIAATERELQSITGKPAGFDKLPPEFRAQAEMLGVASRRIQHLRVAAENLKMAEAHDLARQLMQQAEAMEREVQEAKKRLAEEMQKAHGRDHGTDLVRELKQENERLRAEIKELRQKLEKR